MAEQLTLDAGTPAPPAAAEAPKETETKAPVAAVAPAAPTSLLAAAVETPEGTEPNATQGEPAKATQAAPVVAQVKVPEGVDDADLAKAFEEAKGDPQKVADAVWAHREREVEKIRAESQQRFTDWQKQVSDDPEIGGKWLNDDGSFNRSNPNVTAALRVLNHPKYGSEGLRKFLASTPAGSQPDVIRLLVRVGNSLSESSVAGTTTNPSKGGFDHRSMYDASPEMNP